MEKHLKGQVSGDAAVIFADKGRIQQVLTNLVSNAIKYSNDGGMIHVVIEDTKNSGIIHVEDNGIGIPQEDLGRILKDFTGRINPGTVKPAAQALVLQLSEQSYRRTGET